MHCGLYKIPSVFFVNWIWIRSYDQNNFAFTFIFIFKFSQEDSSGNILTSKTVVIAKHHWLFAVTFEPSFAQVHAVSIHHHFWQFEDALMSEHLAFLVLFKSMSYRTVNDSHWKHRWCLLGLFFLLPNNIQSKSPYMTVIFFVSASKRTKQHISSASFDRFWDDAPSVRARKELLFQSCTEYMRGSCKINQDRAASSFPVKILFLMPEIHG